MEKKEKHLLKRRVTLASITGLMHDNIGSTIKEEDETNENTAQGKYCYYYY